MTNELNDIPGTILGLEIVLKDDDGMWEKNDITIILRGGIKVKRMRTSVTLSKHSEFTMTLLSDDEKESICSSLGIPFEVDGIDNYMNKLRIDHGLSDDLNCHFVLAHNFDCRV